jgi:putative ABC transport system permease protein
VIWLWWHGFVGAARRYRLRTLVQMLAIAVGVALGYAVSLVNHAALAEFSSALRSINGEPDAAVAGTRAGFPEALFARVGAHPDVAAASPVLETDVLVLGTGEARPPRLLVVGLDVLRAARFSTALLPRPAGDGDGRFALFGDGIHLSPAALERFGVQPGARLRVRAGDRVVELAVAGTLPGARPGSLVGVMAARPAGAADPHRPPSPGGPHAKGAGGRAGAAGRGGPVGAG